MFYSSLILFPESVHTSCIAISQNEASYEVVDVSEEWVREFKSGRYKYAHTVEYSTDDGIKQYTAPLMCKEYPVGFVGTLRYNDSVVVLLEEVTDSTTSTVITLGILVVFILSTVCT